MLSRFIAFPVLGSLVVVGLSWAYSRSARRPEAALTFGFERDPLGMSDGVAAALERATEMKVTSEAEALASAPDWPAPAEFAADREIPLDALRALATDPCDQQSERSTDPDIRPGTTRLFIEEEDV